MQSVLKRIERLRVKTNVYIRAGKRTFIVEVDASFLDCGQDRAGVPRFILRFPPSKSVAFNRRYAGQYGKRR